MKPDQFPTNEPEVGKDEVEIPNPVPMEIQPRKKRTTDLAIEPEDLELKERRDEQRRRGTIGDYFDYSEDGVERVEKLFDSLEPFFRSGVVNREDIKNRLLELVGIKNRREFIDRAFSILKPIYKLGMRDAEGKHIEKIIVNQAVHCEVKRNTIELHFPTTGIELSRLEELFMGGLKDLAEIIEDYPTITHIHADSRLIKKHPDRMEGLGFTLVKGETLHSMGALYQKKISSVGLGKNSFEFWKLEF